MRAKAVTADEQYRLIMKCRVSGMTDYQWCIAHNIKPGTFYNWVRRLRQDGNMDIPASAENTEPCQGWQLWDAIPSGRSLCGTPQIIDVQRPAE